MSWLFVVFSCFVALVILLAVGYEKRFDKKSSMLKAKEAQHSAECNTRMADIAKATKTEYQEQFGRRPMSPDLDTQNFVIPTELRKA